MRLHPPPGLKLGVGHRDGISLPLTKFSGAPEYLCYIVFVCPTIHVSARIDERLVAWLDEEAESHRWSRSQALSWALELASNRSGEKLLTGNQDGKHPSGSEAGADGAGARV
jgi:hypothetical protein